MLDLFIGYLFITSVVLCLFILKLVIESKKEINENFFTAFIEIKKLSNDVTIPFKAKLNDAGYDIMAHIKEDIIIKPKEIKLIPTGLAVNIPEGYEIQVRSRSGLAAKKGIFVLNSPGTIDCGYRGEIGVILANYGPEDVKIESGMRIAQLVVSKLPEVFIVETSQFSNDEDRGGGFGSTGI